MNITKFSDYALRVLIYLAVHAEEKSTAETISVAYDISYHHVAKAAQWLVREGYVQSERGRSGGISLLKPAAQINIGDVVKAAEAGTVLVECHKPEGGTCCIAPACGLNHALAEAEAAFFKTLQNYSLADIVKNKSKLLALL